MGAYGEPPCSAATPPQTGELRGGNGRLGQPRLADACLSREQEQAALAAARPGEDLGELLQLAFATDHRIAPPHSAESRRRRRACKPPAPPPA